MAATHLEAMDTTPALLDGIKHHMFTLGLHLTNLGPVLPTALFRSLSNPMVPMLINLPWELPLPLVDFRPHPLVPTVVEAVVPLQAPAAPSLVGTTALLMATLVPALLVPQDRLVPLVHHSPSHLPVPNLGCRNLMLASFIPSLMKASFCHGLRASLLSSTPKALLRLLTRPS